MGSASVEGPDPEASVLPRDRSGARRLLLVVLLINIGLYAPIEVAYLMGEGLSAVQISLLNLSIPFFCALLELPTGLVGDLVGRKWTLVLCSLAFVLAPVLLLVGGSLPLFVVAYLLEAIGWSLFSGNTEAMVVEATSGEPRDVSRQLTFFFASFTLGAVVGGIINSALLLWGGGNLRLVLMTMIFFRLGSLVTAVAVRDVQRVGRQRRSPADGLKVLRQAVAVTRERFSLFIILFEASGRLSFYLPVVVQLLLLEAGLTLAAFGIVSSALLGLQYLAQLKNDRIINRLGRNSVLHSTTCLILVGLLLLMLPGIAPVVIGCLLVQIAGPVRFQCLALMKNEVVDDASRATYLSCVSLCVMVLNSCFLAVTAWLIDENLVLGLVSLVGVIAATSLLVAPLIRWQRFYMEGRMNEVAN
jgi:MFS family permease